MQARAATNRGSMQLQFLTGRHRWTIWKVLQRHGISRRPRRSHPRQSMRRYEWTEAGALLHIDAFELPKFDRPGHWAHGDGSSATAPATAARFKVIGVIDDHPPGVLRAASRRELHGGQRHAAARSGVDA